MALIAVLVPASLASNPPNSNAQLVINEHKQAMFRARQLFGPGAYAIRPTPESAMQLYVVGGRNGELGTGASWDEAFADAGASLFAETKGPKLVEKPEPADLKSVFFTFYKNSETDPQGRMIAMLDGYKEGNKLQIAYRGKVDVAGPIGSKEDLLKVAESLFRMFNVPGERPADYRGPTMDVGDVVEIQGICFACEPCGFKQVEIWKSPIHYSEWY